MSLYDISSKIQLWIVLFDFYWKFYDHTLSKKNITIVRYVLNSAILSTLYYCIALKKLFHREIWNLYVFYTRKIHSLTLIFQYECVFLRCEWPNVLPQACSPQFGHCTRVNKITKRKMQQDFQQRYAYYWKKSKSIFVLNLNQNMIIVTK